MVLFVEETSYSGPLFLELQCRKGYPPILHIKSMFIGLEKKKLLRSSPLVYHLQSHNTVGLMMDSLKTDDQNQYSRFFFNSISSFQNMVPTLPTVQFDSP